MKSNNETLILVLTLLITTSFLGLGYWWFHQQKKLQPQIVDNSNVNNSNTKISNTVEKDVEATKTERFTYPESIPSGTSIRINGSTSLAHINQALQQAFEQKFPQASVEINAQGSSYGLQALLAGKIDIAAISRPLKPQEKQKGLETIMITKDAIAIVVGVSNPYRRGLSPKQVTEIFTGKIDNWVKIGGEESPINVINRPEVSGTRQMFQNLVLEGQNFGNSPNFKTLDRDATTPILRILAKDGISYATYNQVANQQTVRVVPIKGLTPESPEYPYQRSLFYAYQAPPSAQVEAFLGYTTSSIGKQIIEKSQLQGF